MQSQFRGPIVLPLGGFIFRPLHREEMLEAYRLRHRLVCEKWGWLDPDPSGREIDIWDGPDTVQAGAFLGDKLVGYVRLVPDSLELDGNTTPRRVMTLRVFQHLITRKGAPDLPVEQTGDISRLLFDPDFAAVATARQLRDLYTGLFWVVYQESVRLGIQYWYFVTGMRIFRLLRWGCRFPVQNLGSGITSDNRRNYALLLDLGAAARRVRWANPRFYRMFVLGQVPTLPVTAPVAPSLLWEPPDPVLRSPVVERESEAAAPVPVSETALKGVA